LKSAASNVDDYIAGQPDAWRQALGELRAACRTYLAGYDEVMEHGMPTYRRGDQGEVAFARQARYLSLYILRQSVLEAHRSRLSGLDVGKGCIRYRRPAQIDWPVVADLLLDTAAGAGEVC
jgi:uncharacterized protein YdhG (YjbR/CyaY superfamily)